MKCKNCGGELLFQKEKGICQSCGAVFAIDVIYESVDVYIAYKESDELGRRTKDSLIAQEVYKGLEKAKIHTFYERISADGLAGEELEAILYAARQKAKILLVLGSSVENFCYVTEKCGSVLEDKTVIPFCVDINPGEIPKVLGKIQAVNYNTIGWEQDLVNGLYKLLGREKEVDTAAVYKKARNRRLLLMGALVIALLITLVVVVAVLPDRKKDAATTQLPTGSTTEAPAELPTEAPEKPLTQQEKFAKAQELTEQGEYCEALALLYEIPGHSGSSHEIKRIYSKYEGYYQNDIYDIHIDIADDSQITVEVNIIANEQVTSIDINTELSVDRAKYDYVDNYKNTGTIQIILNNDGIVLEIKEDKAPAEKEIFFALSGKSDQPIRIFDKDLLMGWLANNITLSELRKMNYTIEWMQDMDRGSGEVVLCKLEGAEIYLSCIFEYNGMENYEYDRTNRVYNVCGVMAPAEWGAPELIGENCSPKIINDQIYYPNKYFDPMTYYFGNSMFDAQDEIISNNTLLGVVTKQNLLVVFDYDTWEDTVDKCGFSS